MADNALTLDERMVEAESRADRLLCLFHEHGVPGGVYEPDPEDGGKVFAYVFVKNGFGQVIETPVDVTPQFDGRVEFEDPQERFAWIRAQAEAIQLEWWLRHPQAEMLRAARRPPVMLLHHRTARRRGPRSRRARVTVANRAGPRRKPDDPEHHHVVLGGASW
jgi:hypothetical protein